jgi:hypothetical protein
MVIGLKPISAHAHSVKPTWAVRPTTGLAGPHDAARVYMQRAWRARPRARSEHVSWHGSRQLIGGYPMAKLRTEVDPSDGASPGTAWPKVEVMDRPS